MNKKKKVTEEQVSESFKKSFYKRFGYTPLIVLEKPSSKRPSLIMSLEELDGYFRIFIDKTMVPVRTVPGYNNRRFVLNN